MADTLAVHGGNLRALSARSGLPADRIIDFSANLNPLGPPDWLSEEIREGIPELLRYPDPDASRLREAAAERWSVAPESVVCANGSDELFRAIVRGLGIERAIVPVPSYASYASTGVPTEAVQLREDAGFAVDFELLARRLRSAGDGAALFLGVPNNPTGLLPDREKVIGLAAEFPSARIVADEAFLDFADGGATLAKEGPPNLVAVRSLTKFWTVPGLRIGLALCPDAETALRIRSELSQWPLNAFAERVGARALGDRPFTDKTIRAIKTLREDLAGALGGLPGVRVQGGAAADFLLLRVQGASSRAIEEATLRRGVAVRDCGNFPALSGSARPGGVHGWIRVAVKSAAENRALVAALEDARNDAETAPADREAD